MMVMLSFLLPDTINVGHPISAKAAKEEELKPIPSMELALVSCARSVTRSSGRLSQVWPSCMRR